MRCLVTGASGFLGSSLVGTLLARGHTVVVLLRPSTNLSRLHASLHKVEVLYGDLWSRDSRESCDPLSDWREQVKGIDAVFHLAWSDVAAEFFDHPDQIQKNLPAAFDLWDVVRAFGCKIWIGLGSQAEYGPVDGVLRQETPTLPSTAYGVAKLAAGLTTAKLCQLAGIRHVWFRLLSAYGPGDDERHMIPSVIRALLHRRRPALTRGDQVWDYIYVDDVSDALCTALEGTVSGTFNLGSGTSTTVRFVVEYIRDLIDPHLPIGFGELDYRPNQVMRLEADMSPWRSATGWAPKVSLQQGLQQTVNWSREQLGW